MSLIFRKKAVKVGRPEVGTVRNMGTVAPSYGHRSVKYVELFGQLASGSLGAGLSSYVIDYTVPDGHCAELYAIGVQPDIDAGATTSNLKELEICYDGKGTGIKFLTNHMGKNFLPYGDADSLQPIRLLDYPMRAGNLTIKYNEGMRVQIKATAKGTLQSEVNCRAKILLYEPEDVMRYYGATISNFATLAGGVSQSLPQMLFAEYVEDYTTSTRSKWEDAYVKSVKDYEQVQLQYLGVVPHANADELKLFDYRLKWEAPEYEPYWKVKSGINALPFGDDADYQPTAKLPSVIADHVYTNTDLKVQVKDNGAGAATISVQLLGVYRRLR